MEHSLRGRREFSEYLSALTQQGVWINRKPWSASSSQDIVGVEILMQKHGLGLR